MYLNNNPNSHSDNGTKGGDKDEKHRKWCFHPTFTEGQTPTHKPPPRPGPHPSNINIINTIDKVKRATSWSCAVLHVLFLHLWIHGETTQESSSSNTWTVRKVIFKRKKKMKEKKSCRGTAPGRGKGVLPLPEDFLCTPLIFMSCNEWTEIQRPLLRISRYSISRLWRKTKLKEDEFLSVLWIINLKNKEKFHRAPCHDFSCRLSLSIQATNLNFLNFNTIHGYIRESVFMYVYIYLCVI